MAINYKEKGPFADTKNQTHTDMYVFYNFGLPAVGTCPNAPGACKTLVQQGKNKKTGRRETQPVCFAVRPVTNYHFEQKTASAQNNKQGNIVYKSNSIYKQYANLFFSFDKNKSDFMKWLQKQLCPDMKSSFNMYFNQINQMTGKSTNGYDPNRGTVLGYTPQNIWDMLELHFTGSINNGSDFLPNINPTLLKTYGIFVSYMISEITNKYNKERKSGRDIYFRLHYSGDFYNEEYFEKWITITDYFANNKKIHFMAYTKEIENIEIWLGNRGRNLQGGPRGINIKLVFSEMQGFGPYNDTSTTAMDAYNRLNAFQPCMKYTVVSSIPQGYTGQRCKLVCGNSCMSCYDSHSQYTKDVYVEIF